jgi:hypothetical protein
MRSRSGRKEEGKEKRNDPVVEKQRAEERGEKGLNTSWVGVP